MAEKELEAVDPSWEQDWNAEPVKEEPLVLETEQQEEEPAGLVSEGEETEQPEVKEPDPVTAAIKELEAKQKQSSDSVIQQVSSLADQLRQVNAEAALAKKLVTPDGPSKDQIDAAAKDPESWDKFKEEWPDWAGPIREMMEHKIKAAQAAPIDVLKLKEELRAEMRAELEREKAEQRAIVESQKAYEDARTQVMQAHPDFDQTRVSPEFTAWKETQSPGIQALANSMNPADAIQMISLYKQSRPPVRTAAGIQADRQAKLHKAVVPSRSQVQGQRQGVSFEGLDYHQTWDLDSKLKEAASRNTRA